MKTIDCTHAEHGTAILQILNEAIVNSTAVYDYVPRPPDSMTGWFAVKAANGFPVIGIEDESGALLGFASYGTFRAWPAYKYSVEHSIYVRSDQRGKGLGTRLLEALVTQAQARDVHMMIGGIDAGNAASISLHRRLGFEHAGTVKQAGYKFGRWLDLAFYQRIFTTPKTPLER
jgi:L-amino acid N-acyltransferase YncA